MKKLIALLLAALCVAALFAGCGETAAPETAQAEASQTQQAAEKAEETETTEETEQTEEVKEPEEAEPAEPALPDGIYTADFNTDSTMFRANEACDGKGTLTVRDGEMTIHVSLVSKTILNLFPGFAEDAQKDGAVLLEPSVDSVTYSDGWSDEVYGFDIPVPVLDEEFDMAIIGKKGKWYDHRISVTNPEPLVESGKTAAELNLEDGVYTAEVTFAGGSGKAYILSPVTVTVSAGEATATLVWSSSNYDYMLVDDVKYEVLSTENGSTFEVPVRAFDEALCVIGNTTAMGNPHEVEYTLCFASETLTAEGAQ